MMEGAQTAPMIEERETSPAGSVPEVGPRLVLARFPSAIPNSL
jgi:hypothetical protein